MDAPRPPLLPPDAFSEAASERLGRLVFILACAAVALWDLSGRSIYHRDLPRFATIAREMVRSGDWLVPTQYGEAYVNKPILYVWAVALPSAIAGDATAFLMRLPNALALVATAGATALWGAARSGSRVVGRAAGLMVLTTWFVTELGRVGRPDMLATAASTLAAAFVDRAVLGRGGPRDWLLAGLSMGAGLLSKGPVSLLVPLALVALPRAAVPLRTRLARARPASMLAVALAVAGLWIVPVALRGGWSHVERLLHQVSERVEGRGNHIEGPFLYLVGIPVAALPWSPLYLASAIAFAFRRVRGALGDGAHVGAAASAFLVLSAVPTKEIRYASILVPPLAVATAQAAAFLVARARRPAPLSRALLVGGVAAVLASLGAGFLLARVPSALPFAGPPALLLLLGGIGALRASRIGLAAPGLAGRIAGLALLAACVAPCVYWPYLGRYLVTKSDREEQAVLSALEPGVPAVILGGKEIEGALTPDDLFAVAAEASYASGPAGIPSATAAPRVTVISLLGQREDTARSRGEAPREVLRRVRSDGRTLVVLRFGPP